MSLEDLLGTRDGPPQVVILARPLSSRRTIVELQRLSSVLPSSSIVVISALSDRRAMRRALIAGASGFVHLDDIKTALAPAVRSAAAGYVSVPRSHVRSLHRPEFSHRERQVLRLVVFGRTNGEIARHLCLAESTVKTHLSTAFRKLGAHSRSEAATLVLDDSGDLFHWSSGPPSSRRCSGPGEFEPPEAAGRPQRATARWPPCSPPAGIPGPHPFPSGGVLVAARGGERRRRHLDRRTGREQGARAATLPMVATRCAAPRSRRHWPCVAEVGGVPVDQRTRALPARTFGNGYASIDATGDSHCGSFPVRACGFVLRRVIPTNAREPPSLARLPHG